MPVVVAATTTVWLVASAILFWNPSGATSATDLEPADAVFVFGGGGPRIPTGEELVAGGIAPELVIFRNVNPTAEHHAGDYLCLDPAWPNASCVEPDSINTRGEARKTAAIAAENSWSSVIVIVSTDQVTRARLLLDRCYDGQLQIVGVPHDQSRLLRAVYETGALTKAALGSGC